MVVLAWAKWPRAAPILRGAVFVAVGSALSWRALPQVSRAAPSPAEAARVRVAGSLIDDVVRGLLPVDVVLQAPALKAPDGGVATSEVTAAITELRYCGVTDRGAGHFRALVRLGSPFGRGASPPALADEDACRKGLNDLARATGARVGGNDEIVVADLEAVWRPWELRLVVARTSGPAPPKPGVPQPLGAVLDGGRRELLTISTAGFRLVIDAGRSLVFHAAPTFASDAIEIAAVLGDGSAAPPASRPSGGAAVAGLSGTATVAAELPHTFSNQILRMLTQVEPFPLVLDQDVIDLQNASVAGGTGSLTVTGTATPRALRESVRLTVQAGGADLRVAGIRADAQLESCAGLAALAALACNGRNVARNTVAATFAAAMTQKYQGQLVRELAGEQQLRFDAGDRRLELRGDLQRLVSGPRLLSVVARVVSPGAAH